MAPSTATESHIRGLAGFACVVMNPLWAGSPGVGEVLVCALSDWGAAIRVHRRGDGQKIAGGADDHVDRIARLRAPLNDKDAAHNAGILHSDPLGSESVRLRLKLSFGSREPQRSLLAGGAALPSPRALV
jgi:hypothetical protein